MAWSSICCPKEVGGLGVRRLYDISMALVSKLGWLLYKRPADLLVKALLVKYLKNQHLLNAKKKPGASWLWQGILKASVILEKGLYFLIKGGAQVDVWKDPWLPFIPSFKPFTRVTDGLPPPNMMVFDSIDQHLRLWKVDLIKDLFDASSSQAILATPLPSSQEEVEDIAMWRLSKKE
ncbi:hypothetical protein CJ030_MR2G006033 [Morella rubra]|uniref:Uncharacterized protein n=1 Tax=Morella rubra TaxID=262757 RepID=A0A6A1WDI9_9ROSI|nr:hypothetical protein CJ030_MR2G006033 [Morella rubra]